MDAGVTKGNDLLIDFRCAWVHGSEPSLVGYKRAPRYSATGHGSLFRLRNAHAETEDDPSALSGSHNIICRPAYGPKTICPYASVLK